jgi:hypothetical protein
MSRSYARKYRICGTIKGMKRFANKAVRQNKTFCENGNKFKRLFCSWSINDGGRARPFPYVGKKSKWFGESDVDWVRKLRRK